VIWIGKDDRGVEYKCSLMKVNSLIKVRQDTPLQESVSETNDNVVERCGTRSMTSRMECKCSPMQLNGLI
jgi:hypothetical protein